MNRPWKPALADPRLDDRLTVLQEVHLGGMNRDINRGGNGWRGSSSASFSSGLFGRSRRLAAGLLLAGGLGFRLEFLSAPRLDEVFDPGPIFNLERIKPGRRHERDVILAFDRQHVLARLEGAALSGSDPNAASGATQKKSHAIVPRKSMTHLAHSGAALPFGPIRSATMSLNPAPSVRQVISHAKRSAG